MLEIGKAEAAAAARVIESTYLFRYGDPKDGHGNECLKFERELAKKIGRDHALLVTSGTAALVCALAGLGVGPGDEVIVPAYTFIASALAPLTLGALPVIAEVDESLTLDPKEVEAKISRRTKAIMPVHMVGLPANMNGIMRVARKHEVRVLEDAAQAFGGRYKNRWLGTIGDVGAYSFNYYKNATAGEGGGVVTNDDEVFMRALMHHDGGLSFWPHGKAFALPVFAGWNYRASEIQGAILRVQLRKIDRLLAKTRAQKKQLVAAVAAHPKLRSIKYNDLEGDCSTVAALRFRNEEQARGFAARLEEQGEGCMLPIDSGRHVYTNWEAIMERRGSYHPALDAFKHPKNRGSKARYEPDMCPRTLEILSRTVFLDIRPRTTAARARNRIRAMEKAAEGLP
ncbi:MAG TPA: DegT/DnrJ/EryC1/StrS family aminotransferase [Armatimonadota bacterium]|nr:DegT/DnrJ/EryC1/StrS family aminotransferase [Armatimonadota bacterium]